uniref:Uncharacterized protein n=1 Tax=Bracon brevicornis TaxID=1563983 RepID=A0A6V7IGD4_9HYME
MDDLRGSPAGRRLSQILDPIARLTSDFGSNSAPCSPRLGMSSRNASSVAESSSAQESPRLLARHRSGCSRQPPIPPPRPQRNDSPIHSRNLTSTYVNVPCDNAHIGRRDKPYSDSVKSNIGYVELRDKAVVDKRNNYRGPVPFTFTSESSGRVEYADKRFYPANRTDEFVTYANFDNEPHSEASSPLFDSAQSTMASNVEKILSSFANNKHQQFRRGSIDRDMTYASSLSGATSVSDDQREPQRYDRPTGYSSSKSFDAGYSATVEELNWQERCLELQLELHRSRSQATRVRDMLREKVSSY